MLPPPDRQPRPKSSYLARLNSPSPLTPAALDELRRRAHARGCKAALMTGAQLLLEQAKRLCHEPTPPVV